VIIDEVHAFAGDDRGWHLLAVLERLTRLAGRPLQRIGLSATVGNPESLLGWLRGGAGAEGRPTVVTPSAGRGPHASIQLDYVGNLGNAATVIASLYRGEKRLVFAESRRAVEAVAVTLRSLGVETFVSHSSLAVEERRRAERAFSESRDCAIVSTSTFGAGYRCWRSRSRASDRGSGNGDLLPPAARSLRSPLSPIRHQSEFQLARLSRISASRPAGLGAEGYLDVFNTTGSAAPGGPSQGECDRLGGCFASLPDSGLTTARNPGLIYVEVPGAEIVIKVELNGDPSLNRHLADVTGASLAPPAIFQSRAQFVGVAGQRVRPGRDRRM